MLKAVAQRVGAACAVAAVVSVLTFVALRVIPGDAAVLVLGLDASPENLAALRASMGLDEPLPRQFASWLGGVLSGDWGVSRTYGAPVLEVILNALPVTLGLAVYAMLLALVVAVPLGVFSALHPGSPVDAFARTVMQLASAAPGFWVAILLMLLFAGHLGWFPVSGYAPASEGLGTCVCSLTLPAVTLAVGECGVLIRTVRSSMLTALRRDCMLSAELKGLSRARTVAAYALRSAAVAPLTVAGLQLAKLAGGTAVVESIFALPGLGRLLLTAVQQRDLLLVQGTVLFVTLAVVLVTLVVDLLVMAADPGVRRQQRAGGGEL